MLNNLFDRTKKVKKELEEFENNGFPPKQRLVGEWESPKSKLKQRGLVV